MDSWETKIRQLFELTMAAKVARDAVVVFGGATGMLGSNVCIEGRKRGFKMIALARYATVRNSLDGSSSLLHSLPCSCNITVCMWPLGLLHHCVPRKCFRGHVRECRFLRGPSMVGGWWRRKNNNTKASRTLFRSMEDTVTRQQPGFKVWLHLHQCHTRRWTR